MAYQQDRYGHSGSYGREPSDYGPPPPDGGFMPMAADDGYYDGGRDHARGYDVAGPSGVDMGDGSADYMNYTERRPREKLASGRIDPDNGIAPRRCTDCICLFVFLFYVLGMMILINVCKTSTIRDKPWSDLRRLTHGHDYAGRLCGVDDEVASKPYLIWCRTKWDEKTATPSALNLPWPTCISRCPKVDEVVDNKTTVTCLFNHTVNVMSLPGTTAGAGAANMPPLPFGVLETYHLQVQQSEAETPLYNTTLFGGRFCVPEDVEMREQVVHGPLRLLRMYISAGSLQDPWVLIFQVTILAMVFSAVYVYMVFMCPRILVPIVLYATWILVSIGGLFFLYAILPFVAEQLQKEDLLKVLRFEEYKALNPFFEVHGDDEATAVSLAIGIVLSLSGCAVLGTITHVASKGFTYTVDLLDAAEECVKAMPSMLYPTIALGFTKFLLMWACGYNFMYLFAAGYYDDELLVVNDVHYKDRAALYIFDTSIIKWMVLYVFGWIWVIELTTSVGQFFISYATISWYFMRKEGGQKTGVPPSPPLHASYHLVSSHMGSLCLGAAIIPWVRVLRVFNWVEDESVPDSDARCCPDTAVCQGGCCTILNTICSSVGSACGHITSLRKSCSPDCCMVPKSDKYQPDGLVGAGCAYRYSKNAYNDMIIRSQHFKEASSRALRLINRNNVTKMFILENEGCQVITAVGVMGVGFVCAMLVHLWIMNSKAMTDPASPTFIPEPFVVDFIAFWLCSYVAYDWMALFEHTADTLLYCYAWNKKYAQESGGVEVEEYLPETLRDLADLDLDDDKQQLLGQANPAMLLSTYMGGGSQRQARMQQPGMSTMSGSPVMSGRSGNSRQFGGQYQALPNPGSPAV